MGCKCGEDRRRQVIHTFRRTVAGATFTASTPVDACAGCGEPRIPVARTTAFERAVAADLARHGPVSGETFRVIRKAHGFDRREIAELVGVAPEVIGGWEDERRGIDAAAWTIVATLALDSVEGARPLRARLRARSRSRRPSVIEVSIDNPGSRTVANLLHLLTAPASLTDTDIADVLDVDHATLHTSLRDLVSAGLLRRVPTATDCPDRWEPITRDRRALLDAARAARVDLETPLPQPQGREEDAARRAKPAPTAARAC
jgi:hypothetical protein